MAEGRIQPWYRSRPERLQWELEQFRLLGLGDPKIVEETKGLSVNTSLQWSGGGLPLTVVYPVDFPIVVPRVFGPKGLLVRHQDPDYGNYCLLESEDDWEPDGSAANLIADNLRRLLEDTAAGGEAVAQGEADMPEPTSSQLRYEPERVVVVPEPFWSKELEATTGTMSLVPVHAVGVHMLVDAKGIGRVTDSLRDRFRSSPNQEGGHWVALSEAPPIGSAANSILGAALQADEAVGRRLTDRARQRRTSRHWVGITFLEEGPTRAEQRRAWAFVAVSMADGTWKPSGLVRAQAFTLEERQRRTPELSGLEQCRFVVVGAGSLGSPIAVELVKAGAGHTDIVDYDTYDVNNAVRHVLPVSAAGTQKAKSLAEYCKSMNPFVKIIPHNTLVGHDPKIEDLVRGATLVVDTTGSTTTARVLYKYCRLHEVPLLIASLTNGAYAGEIALLKPGGACPVCFELDQAEGKIAKPDVGPKSNVTPVGCSHPAFFGAGFEATEVAVAAVRMAVVASAATSYPKLPQDWLILNLRREPRRIQGVNYPREDCWFHPYL